MGLAIYSFGTSEMGASNEVMQVIGGLCPYCPTFSFGGTSYHYRGYARTSYIFFYPWSSN